MKPRHFLLGASTAALLTSPALGATGPAMRELVEVLRAEGAISQQAYEALKRTLDGQAAYLAYHGLDDTVLTIGHIKESLGMEVLGSSNSITFVERALPGVFAPSYSIGVQGQRRIAERMTATLGVFGEGISKSESDDESTADGLDEGWSATGRLTWNPLLTEANIIHLGAAASFRKANDFGGTQVDADFFRLRQRPESSVGSIRLVNTGSLTDVDELLTWGLEAPG